MKSLETYTFDLLHGRIVLRGRLGAALISALLLEMLSVAVNPTRRSDINCFWTILAVIIYSATLLELASSREVKKALGVALYTLAFSAILYFTTWCLGGFAAIALTLFYLLETIEVKLDDLDVPQTND